MSCLQHNHGVFATFSIHVHLFTKCLGNFFTSIELLKQLQHVYGTFINTLLQFAAICYSLLSCQNYYNIDLLHEQDILYLTMLAHNYIWTNSRKKNL
jgi:hypothetical protein